MNGKNVWYVPDGYITSKSVGEYLSHETISVINDNNQDANIKITLFFEDQEPLANFMVTCPAYRGNHIRLDKIKNQDGILIPRDTCYALKIESNVPIICQHSRLNTCQSEYTLMSTIAY